MTHKTVSYLGFVALLVAAAGLLAPAPAHGQAATGAIVGTVVDANGGGLPGASITVSNPATGFT
ncbi:MAG TPA: hypothetical protein VLW17_01240, partial [Thermoanaerobaculaceae bacterium]|nr:hypothetical protein [Thermoanaerobaculaceae bacterium]